MGKSLNHASSIGLTRNLRTGYVSPQYHVLYDNKYETVMRGLEDNDAITDYIWENLVDQAVERSVNTTIHSHIPTSHQTWISPENQDTQQSKDIDAEVTRRIRSGSINPINLDVQSSTQIASIESEEDTNIQDTKGRLTRELNH